MREVSYGKKTMLGCAGGVLSDMNWGNYTIIDGGTVP